MSVETSIQVNTDPKRSATPPSRNAISTSTSLPRVAFGPTAPGWGSWDWVGQDIAKALYGDFHTSVFPNWHVPRQMSLSSSSRHHHSILLRTSRADRPWSIAQLTSTAHRMRSKQIKRCLGVATWSLCMPSGLQSYFVQYAPVEYIDHHVKFIPIELVAYRPEGFLLWVGAQSNLQPLVDWVWERELPAELRILTNLDRSRAKPEDFGFPKDSWIRIENWSAGRQMEWMTGAKAALDIKRTDFRSHHKPPAKALDYIAAGLPLAMNYTSSASATPCPDGLSARGSIEHALLVFLRLLAGNPALR